MVLFRAAIAYATFVFYLRLELPILIPLLDGAVGFTSSIRYFLVFVAILKPPGVYARFSSPLEHSLALFLTVFVVLGNHTLGLTLLEVDHQLELTRGVPLLLGLYLHAFFEVPLGHLATGARPLL